ncbi:MAG TPA: hypothetical protein VKH42_09510 [Vicinamibacterales bacterium]|nr:hypothetical protein [Vicinamibacterales bacterium]
MSGRKIGITIERTGGRKLTIWSKPNVGGRKLKFQQAVDAVDCINR